jgi:hypothetical protein
MGFLSGRTGFPDVAQGYRLELPPFLAVIEVSRDHPQPTINWG